MAEFSGVSAQAGEALLHQCGASPMGSPHQPVLFLAAVEQRGRLWGGWVYGVCFWGSVQGEGRRSHLGGGGGGGGGTVKGKLDGERGMWAKEKWGLLFAVRWKPRPAAEGN